MRKIAKSASRIFRKDDNFQPLPVRQEEDPGEMTALPARQYAQSIEPDVGCFSRFRIKKKRSTCVYTLGNDTETVESTDRVPLASGREMLQNFEDDSKYSGGPATMIAEDQQHEDRQGKASSLVEAASEIDFKSLSMSSSSEIRPRVKLPPLSSEVWTTVDESTEYSELALIRQSPHVRRRVVSEIPKASSAYIPSIDRRVASDCEIPVSGGWSSNSQPRSDTTREFATHDHQQRRLRRATTLVSSEQSSMGRRTVSSFGFSSIQAESYVEPPRGLSRAPSSKVQIKKKKPVSVPVPETPKKATDWADMDDSFSDNSSELRQLREELRVSSRRVSTPSLTSHRRMRAAQAARVASDTADHNAAIDEEAEEQANDIFFIPSPTMPKEPSFHGRGFCGSIASLPSTLPTTSSPPISPHLLRAPLPTNCVELLHEAADRCDRELARLRLNIRMMKRNKVEAENKIHDLRPKLAAERAEWFEMVALFEAKVRECEAFGVSLEGIGAIDDVHESMLSSAGAGERTEFGYEAEMGAFDSSAMMLAEQDRIVKGRWSATVEDEVVFEGDDSQDEAFAGYEADLSGEDEMETARAEERRLARLTAAARDPVEDLADAALRF